MSSPVRRRVTRSASREIEATNLKDSSHTSRPLVKGHQRVQSKGKVLEAVTEESPFKSPPRKSISSHGVSDYHEDVANLTGTTILPSEPETDLGNGSSETMIDSLPDLERAAKKVTDILLPASAKDAVSIINMGKRLAGPRNAQNQRLIHAVSKLASETKVFAARSTYIDVPQVHRLLYSLLADSNGFNDWSPDAVLHKANCAFFAREMLLATDSTAMRSAIRNVDGMFPAAFMSDLTRGGLERAPGNSALEKDTFELALEIRTQALINRLEDRQDEAGFDSIAVLKDAFFLEDPEDVFEASEAPLRGFGLESLGGVDGYLPARFRDAAFDRYNDLLLQLPEDASDEIDFPGLRGAFRWQKFVYRAVNWVRRRGDEINRDLKEQQSTEDVRDAFFTLKDTFDGTMETSQIVEDNLEGPSVRETPPAEEELPPPAPEPVAVTRAQPPKQTKLSWLNETAMDRLMQRRAESRASTENSENRRKSDMAAQAQRREKTAQEKRRQTLATSSRTEASQAASSRAAPPRTKPTTPPRIQEPVVREESPLFLRDEDTLELDNETDLNDASRLSLEKSQSPRMTRTRPVISAQPTPTASRRSLLSTNELWRRANHTPAPEEAAATAAAKKKTFIDRQETARRVSPISQSSSVRRNEQRRGLMEISRKRRRTEGSGDGHANNGDDDEEGDDFSTYERVVDLQRRRADKPEPSRKRTRVDETTFDYDAPTQQLQSGLEESARRSSTAVAEYVPPSTAPAVVMTSDRKMWTPAEDQRLTRLIGDYGPKWSVIERQNEIQPDKPGEVSFKDRDQINLKDRARNLKIKFLRERRPLPPNFLDVTIKKADILMLQKRGIEVPVQKSTRVQPSS